MVYKKKSYISVYNWHVGHDVSCFNSWEMLHSATLMPWTNLMDQDAVMLGAYLDFCNKVWNVSLSPSLRLS